mgnify:CR=1 FL=1
MKKRTRNALISLTALALGATVLLTGCSEDAAGSTAEVTSTQQSTTTAATAPTQPAIAKTATGATAEQTSELLSSLTHQEMEELISGNTTLAEMEKKRFNLPETTPAASSESTAEAVSNSTTTAASTEQTAAPSSYDAELQDLINQLYAVKARAESGLNSAIQSAKSEYHALPSNEQTQSRKLSIVMSKSSELKNLQSSCDSEVNTILNKMRKLLRENGQSTALADQALASYESQKSSTYNSLKSQLLG